MDIRIDGVQGLVEPDPGATLEETLDKVRKAVFRSRRRVVSFSLDGEELTRQRQKELSRTRAEQFGRLEVATINPYEASLAVMNELLQNFERLENAYQSVADRFREGQNEEALRILRVCVDFWRMTFNGIEYAAVLLDLKIDQMRVDGRSVAEWLQVLLDVGGRTFQSIQAGDAVRLADLSQYEMKPLIPTFRRVVEEVAGAVRRASIQ